MKNVKITLQDNNQTWKEEGDYGMAAIGNGTHVEVDFSMIKKEEMIKYSLLLATALVILHENNPEAAQKAVTLYKQRTSN